jgi:hypothetical protein
VATRFLRSSVSSSRMLGQRGTSTFTVAFPRHHHCQIELNQVDQELTLPPWIGNEVTGDSFYKKINMRERAVKALRQEPPAGGNGAAYGPSKPGLLFLRPRGDLSPSWSATTSRAPIPRRYSCPVSLRAIALLQLDTPPTEPKETAATDHLAIPVLRQRGRLSVAK